MGGDGDIFLVGSISCLILGFSGVRMFWKEYFYILYVSYDMSFVLVNIIVIFFLFGNMFDVYVKMIDSEFLIEFEGWYKE